MKTLTELFIEVAYKGDWQTINSVDYKFIEHGDTLEIYFMGSYQFSDWWFNFDFKEKVYNQFKVHRGFLRCYNQVRSIILDKIYSRNYKSVIVVGYSHGSALCTLAIEDIKYHFPNIYLKGYAFESPRCVKVPKELRYKWNDLVVIRNGTDLVTHLPPKLFGYDDVGTMLNIKGDTKLIDKWYLPKCIKYHFQQCVLDGLNKL